MHFINEHWISQAHAKGIWIILFIENNPKFNLRKQDKIKVQFLKLGNNTPRIYSFSTSYHNSLHFERFGGSIFMQFSDQHDLGENQQTKDPWAVFTIRWCRSETRFDKLNSSDISGVFELKKIYGERHEEFDPCCEEELSCCTKLTGPLIGHSPPMLLLIGYEGCLLKTYNLYFRPFPSWNPQKTDSHKKIKVNGLKWNFFEGFPKCDDNFYILKDAFADVTYYLLIWRRPKFFLFNYIQPAVLINILALWVPRQLLC